MDNEIEEADSDDDESDVVPSVPLQHELTDGGTPSKQHQHVEVSPFSRDPSSPDMSPMNGPASEMIGGSSVFARRASLANMNRLYSITSSNLLQVTSSPWKSPSNNVCQFSNANG